MGWTVSAGCLGLPKVGELKGIYRKMMVIKTPSRVVAVVMAGRPGGET
jgi:hypothetical protein